MAVADAGLTLGEVGEDDPGAVERDAPGEDHDGAHQTGEAHLAVEHQRDQQTGHHRQRHRFEREPDRDPERLLELPVVYDVRKILGADEGRLIAAEKTDFVEAHPERVAERISDHQDEENQNRQREQQRELKVRQLGGALPSPHISPWSWSARPCPADRKSGRRTTPSSRPPARQHYSPYFLFKSTISSLIASMVSTISLSSCRYSCSVSLSQLLNSSAQTTLQMPLGYGVAA